MTIVVAGGSGFLGTRLRAHLEREGHRVLNLTRSPRPHQPGDIPWPPGGSPGQLAAHFEDADVVIIACNTPSRMAKGAVEDLRAKGVKAGLFRPITLWPFPIRALTPHLAHAKRVVVVEASPGQLEDELRIALSYAGIATPPILPVQRYGGVLPQRTEIVKAVLTAERGTAGQGAVPAAVARLGGAL